MKDQVYVNALNAVSLIGGGKIRQLLAYFPSAKAAWFASETELRAAGLGPKTAARVVTERENIDPKKAWARCEEDDVRLVNTDDKTFPERLTKIAQPPFFLYARGAELDPHMCAVAVVGSRKFTDYGKQACYRLSFDLAKAGVTVVSGLAFGIDATAHRAALDTNGRTIAVLGSSCDDNSIAPRNNLSLAHEMLENGGTLLSEYAPPTPPTVGSFPTRNRIMAGMSLGVLVIEAAEKSGSLITAHNALEENRDVFAVPGSIFSTQSVGTNQLIRSGAKMVTHAGDILEELQIEQRKTTAAIEIFSPESPEEKKIVAILQSETEAVHVDRIIKLSTLDTTIASATLSLLEMKGAVKNTGGNHYIALSVSK